MWLSIYIKGWREGKESAVRTIRWAEWWVNELMTRDKEGNRWVLMISRRSPSADTKKPYCSKEDKSPDPLWDNRSRLGDAKPPSRDCIGGLEEATLPWRGHVAWPVAMSGRDEGEAKPLWAVIVSEWRYDETSTSRDCNRVSACIEQLSKGDKVNQPMMHCSRTKIYCFLEMWGIL